MAPASSSSSSPHSLIVTSSGLSHIHASLLLAQSLRSLGFSVSFAYLSSDSRLLSRLPLPHHLSFHVIEDGKTPDPDPNPLAPFFSTAQMRENLHKLIRDLQAQGCGVTCLVSDSFTPWTQDVADEIGIPRVEYWTASALSHHMFCNLPLLFERGVFPEPGPLDLTRRKGENPYVVEIPGLPPFSSERYPVEMRFLSKEDLVVIFFQHVGDASRRAERILIHTMAELEEEAFRGFTTVGKKAYAIGPLLHHAAKKGEGRRNHGEEGAEKREEVEDCMAWLDGQEASSVLYVAFGSMVGRGALKEEDVQALAMGLEASGVPFLWALPSHLRPQGFVRTSVKGGVVVEWAPQQDVLSHPSVGGFLSHCGWNSAFESICAGVPLICCPLFAEQFANAEFICDIWKIGIELERTSSNGLHRTMVESAVKCLMYDDVGHHIRQRVKDLMHLAQQTSQEGGQSMANLQNFYEDMKALYVHPQLYS